MNDLHLRYRFTDRAGRDVYDVYHDEDRATRKNPLFEIRMVEPQGEDPLIYIPEDTRSKGAGTG